MPTLGGMPEDETSATLGRTPRPFGNTALRARGAPPPHRWEVLQTCDQARPGVTLCRMAIKEQDNVETLPAWDCAQAFGQSHGFFDRALAALRWWLRPKL